MQNGINNAQNTFATLAFNHANAAFIAANNSSGANDSQNTSIQFARNHANAAFNAANTGGADQYARNHANAAFNAANNGTEIIQLWGWGDGASGKLLLNDGATGATDRSSAVQLVTGAAATIGWRAICLYSTDDSGTVAGPITALKADGSLWTWGVNYGGVGGLATAFSSPVQIGIGNTWLQMSASYQNSAAINAAGGLWVTGLNSDGRLGLNDATARDTLNFIPGSNRWVFVACGQTNTYAISTSGALFAWGTNTQGQLGNNVAGSGINASSPVQVTTSALPWKFIAAAPNRWMGIRSDGSLWGCGFNLSASLGEGNAFGAYSSPVQVAAGLNPKWKYVALGDSGSFATSGAIKTDGSLWMWGSQQYGTVGNGIQSIASISTPIQIGSETTWKSLSLYFNSALAVKTDGTLWGWGSNEYRHLADNRTSASVSSPIQIIGSYNSSYEDWLDVKFAGSSGTVIGIKRENILPNFTYDVNKD